MSYQEDDRRLYEICIENGYHRFFALETDFEEVGGVKHIYLACTACGYLKHHEMQLKKRALLQKGK